MRNLFILICLFLYGASQGQSIKGDTWAEARRSRKATIVVHYVESPKYAKKVNGKYTGLCFEIMDHFVEYVESTYGIDIEVKIDSNQDPTNFNAFLETMKKNRVGVFGVGDISITDDRKTYFDFSPPFISNVSVLITSKTVPNLSSIDNISTEFAGMTSVVQKGTSHYKRVTNLKNKYGGFEISIVDNTQAKLDLIVSSTNYFSYVSFNRYQDYILVGNNVKRHPAGDDTGEKFGFIMSKGSDWAPIMAEFFNSNGGYTSSTKYRDALRDNLGKKMVRLNDYITKIEEESN